MSDTQISLSASPDCGAAPKSLLDGVTGEAERLLQVKSLRHRSALQTLGPVDGHVLVHSMYALIKSNYDRGGAHLNKDRSAENWRWPSLIVSKDLERNSAEVRVERAIAAAAVEVGSKNWGNQVPVASGLIRGARDRRRAIDLVRRHTANHFELIELKIASDTPLYAATEVLGYGCLWCVSACKIDPLSGVIGVQF